MSEEPGTPRVRVPEPRHVRSGDSGDVEVDASDLSDRAIPLDVAGTLGLWFRRHTTEVVLFSVTLAVLSVGALFAMRDPGPSVNRTVVVVGPPKGQSIEPYIAVRKRALEDAALSGGERYAVVTFASRLTVAQFDALPVSDPLMTEALILSAFDGQAELVAVSGRDTDGVVNEWIGQIEARLVRQAEGLDEVIAAGPSPSPAADWYRAERERAREALDRLSAGTVVVGAIVKGPVGDLAMLQQATGVLLVDLAPAGKRLDEISPVPAGYRG